MVENVNIHASAIIEDGAEIGEGTSVGPFCFVGSKVRLGKNIELKSHVVIKGDTFLGDENTVFPFAVLGEIPQDKKFNGESTSLFLLEWVRRPVALAGWCEGGSPNCDGWPPSSLL